MHETARTLAGAGLRERSPQKAVSLIRKLDLIADSEIAKAQTVSKAVACKKRCDHCCHRVVFATIPEVLRTAEHVAATFTAGEIQALKQRLQTYEQEVAPRFGVDLHLARPTCPLLVDSECCVYEARPLLCRSLSSYDVDACIRDKMHPEAGVDIPVFVDQRRIIGGLLMGLGEGLSQNKLDRNRCDFARALKVALETPEAGDGFFLNDESFAVAQVFGKRPTQELPSNQTPSYPHYRPGEEPSGNINPSDIAVSRYFEFVRGDTSAAIKALAGKHPIYRLKRITTPGVYAEESEIPFWRDHFIREIHDFAQSEFDPREAFDALKWVQTFHLAYQMNDVKDPLSQFGELLCDQITSKALPSLTMPLDTKWRSGKLKVGYISRNRRNPNGAIGALGVLKSPGREVETYVSNLFEPGDRVSLRFKEEADHYHHLNGNVAQDARLIKGLNLDVLIYTDLGIDGRNYQFASMRLAPIQCTAWGHPVTSGLPTIDYYLSSDLMEPADADSHYTEKLVRLPNSALCYARSHTPISNLSKADFGLDDGPLYLMCQNLPKATPKWDFLYKRINELTGRPVVFLEWLIPGEAEIAKDRMRKAGVNAKWLPVLPRPDYLRLLSLAEVSLDPPGWSGGNTTIEALAMGVPVVTLPGPFMRGRHSLAFLQLANAPGLIAKDADDYIDLAADSTRRKTAMQAMNVDHLFDDVTPVESLDDFLRTVSKR